MNTNWKLIYSTIKETPLAIGRALQSQTTEAHHHLYIISDGAKWVLNEEASELYQLTQTLGINSSLVASGLDWGIRNQCIFYSSLSVLMGLARRVRRGNRIAFPYYHGVPRPEVPEFVNSYEALKLNHELVSKVQVSCEAMKNLILETGIAEGKVHLIRIPVNLDIFKMKSKGDRERARRELGIPASAVVIGSFQKDGNGWGEGLTPKLIKGPDILVDVLTRLSKRIPGLIVLLTGPARGYVKRGLTDAGVPFVHHFQERYLDVPKSYYASDLTLVTSREEGGPKSILESMASGVPVVSTRVGQAKDLVLNGENGWLVDVEDVDALADRAEGVLNASADSISELLVRARATAERNSWRAQSSLWKGFFSGFVE